MFFIQLRGAASNPMATNGRPNDLLQHALQLMQPAGGAMTPDLKQRLLQLVRLAAHALLLQPSSQLPQQQQQQQTAPPPPPRALMDLLAAQQRGQLTSAQAAIETMSRSLGMAPQLVAPQPPNLAVLVDMLRRNPGMAAALGSLQHARPGPDAMAQLQELLHRHNNARNAAPGLHAHPTPPPLYQHTTPPLAPLMAPHEMIEKLRAQMSAQGVLKPLMPVVAPTPPPLEGGAPLSRRTDSIAGYGLLGTAVTLGAHGCCATGTRKRRMSSRHCWGCTPPLLGSLRRMTGMMVVRGCQLRMIASAEIILSLGSGHLHGGAARAVGAAA